MQILEHLYEFGLALPVQWIRHSGNDAQLTRGNVAAQVASSAVAGGVTQPHALHSARVIGRNGLPLDHHGNLGMSEVFSRSGRPVGEHRSQSLTIGEHFGHRHHGFPVSPGQSLAVAVLDEAPFSGFHGHGEQIAEFDRIETVVVALVDQLGDDSDVTIVAIRAQGPRGLVFDTLHFQSSVGSVLDLDFFLARNRTRVAGGIAGEQMFLHILATQSFCALAKGSQLRIAGTQGADCIGDVGNHIGAVDREAAFFWTRNIGFVANGVQSTSTRSAIGSNIFDLAFLARGADHDRLEVLRAADGSGPAAAKGAVVFVHPGREPRLVFTRATDRTDAQVLRTILLFEVFDGRVDVLAPDLRGVADLDMSVFDKEIHRPFRLAFDDDPVETRPANSRGGPSSHMAVGDGSGERRFRHAGPAATHVDF